MPKPKGHKENINMGKIGKKTAASQWKLWAESLESGGAVEEKADSFPLLLISAFSEYQSTSNHITQHCLTDDLISQPNAFRLPLHLSFPGSRLPKQLRAAILSCTKGPLKKAAYCPYRQWQMLREGVNEQSKCSSTVSQVLESTSSSPPWKPKQSWRRHWNGKFVFCFFQPIHDFSDLYHNIPQLPHFQAEHHV